MKVGPRIESVLWMGAGALALAVFLLLGWRFFRAENPAQRLAFKATRVDLVGRLELALARGSEAEKSAVLAISDEDSQAFADQARAATADVDRGRQEMGKLLEAGGTRGERDLLARFAEAFSDLRRIDDEVLRLAVKNTNLKASALSFGPAAEALAEFDGALARAAAKTAASPDALQALRLTSDARIAVLRIQTLLAPHIAEESDARMDRMEASMLAEETRARRALAGLRALSRLRGDSDLAAASSALARYVEIKARIVALSRENTNVRSLALSLNQKRRALALCLDALGALKQAILEEPIAGVTYGRPTIPR
jgi:hypothetical protein